MKPSHKYLIGAGMAVLLALGIGVYSRTVSDVPDEGTLTTAKQFDDTRGLRFCEVFLIGGNALTKDLRASAYNSTGLNYLTDPRNSCPEEFLRQLDLDAYKKHYKVLAVYLNKPRFWAFDRIKVPVGPVREFGELKGQWMGLGIIPKDADIAKPGWLTYRKSRVEKKTELTYFKGKPVFILDDPDGKPWVMKSYRDSHGQTHELLATLGDRYKNLPAGWKFRVAVLDRDLVIAPGKTGVTSLIMQDEFENTFDYVGDGSSNFLP